MSLTVIVEGLPGTGKTTLMNDIRNNVDLRSVYEFDLIAEHTMKVVRREEKPKHCLHCGAEMIVPKCAVRDCNRDAHWRGRTKTSTLMWPLIVNTCNFHSNLLDSNAKEAV